MAATGALSGGPSAASDLLRSSTNGVAGVPLRALGRSTLAARRRPTAAGAVVAKIRKGKKHDYPWPDEIDPNVKGGHLSYLSHFKPLQERLKPVTLPFEKPLVDLEKKIIDVKAWFSVSNFQCNSGKLEPSLRFGLVTCLQVQRMAAETGLDFTDQIISLESKYEQALKDLYRHLTPIQRVSIARHPNRPTFLDHVLNITDKWVELHGDRAGYDDPAIVTGVGSIDGRSYLFIGHQKGRNTKENIQRNFGMPTPHGYRKALRMMYYADHHKLPIITFIDTPGAFADLKSEELGQGEAIAHNLRTMFGLKVPIVSIVIGEGGSGGALAIGCANKLLMLENAVFYVASPEACAAILWKTAKASPKAAEKLRITATELCKLKIADSVIPEPLGGAHADPTWTSQQIKLAVVGAMNELLEMDTPELLHHRMLKFRNLGGFVEGESIDPEKKVNMKKKEEPIVQLGKLGKSDIDLEYEIEKLKQEVLKSKGQSSSESLDLNVNDLVEKLKKEVDQELSEAVEFLGFKDKLEMIRKEAVKSRSSQDQLMDPSLKENIEKLKMELEQGLSGNPNFASLRHKLNVLKKLSKAQKVLPLKQEINKEFREIMSRPDVKEKMDMLKEEISGAGVSNVSDLEDSLKEKILKVKKEVESELAKKMQSMHLDIKLVAPKPLFSELKDKMEELDNEIKERIEDSINSTDLKNKIDMLKLEVEKAGKSPNPETKSKIEEMKQQIKKSLVEAMNSPTLVEKYEVLKQEVAKASPTNALEDDSFHKLDGSMNGDASKGNDSDFNKSRIGINMGSTYNQS